MLDYLLNVIWDGETRTEISFGDTVRLWMVEIYKDIETTEIDTLEEAVGINEVVDRGMSKPVVLRVFDSHKGCPLSMVPGRFLGCISRDTFKECD